MAKVKRGIEMKNRKLDTALLLAACGFKVYPLTAGTKIPVKGMHGEYDATSNKDTIVNWFNYDSSYNLALNLQASGLAVIDLDSHGNGINGIRNYSKYLMEHGNDYMDSLKTYTELTPHGGVHIFYELNHDLGNKDIQLMPGVELLTGKVVIAPSYISKIDKWYMPQYQGYQTLSRDNVQPLPNWIVELANDRQQRTKTINNIPEDSSLIRGKTWTGKFLDELVQGAGKGDRNIYLTHLMGKFVRTGANSDTIYNLLHYANSNFIPPLPANEVNNIFGSILKRSGDYK